MHLNMPGSLLDSSQCAKDAKHWIKSKPFSPEEIMQQHLCWMPHSLAPSLSQTQISSSVCCFEQSARHHLFLHSTYRVELAWKQKTTSAIVRAQHSLPKSWLLQKVQKAVPMAHTALSFNREQWPRDQKNVWRGSCLHQMAPGPILLPHKLITESSTKGVSTSTQLLEAPKMEKISLSAESYFRLHLSLILTIIFCHLCHSWWFL